jgi:hypothetical protein
MAHSNRQAIFANSTIMLEKTTANKGSIITSRAKRCCCGVFCSSPHLAGQALARRFIGYALLPHRINTRTMITPPRPSTSGARKD